jgi:hypothetical protein
MIRSLDHGIGVRIPASQPTIPFLNFNCHDRHHRSPTFLQVLNRRPGSPQPQRVEHAERWRDMRCDLSTGSCPVWPKVWPPRTTDQR